MCLLLPIKIYDLKLSEDFKISKSFLDRKFGKLAIPEVSNPSFERKAPRPHYGQANKHDGILYGM